MRARHIRHRLRWIPTPVRRVLVLVIGGTVALLGLIMLVAPGPGFIVIPLGLAILAIEFIWAKRWLRKIKRTAKGAAGAMKRQVKSANTPPAAPTAS